MPKRARQDEDDYDEGSQRVETAFNTAVSQIVRLVLSKDIKSQFFKRETIPPEFNIKMFGFNKVIQQVNNELEEIHGLKLVDFESKKKKKQYILVSTLKPIERLILSDLWHDSLNSNLIDNNATFKRHFLPTKSQTILPTSNQELVKLGIMLLIISLIIIAENSIPEVELHDILLQFGILNNINLKNSNYGLNLTELIQEFIKRDYLTLTIIRAAVESENVHQYSLGSRSLMEFQPLDVYNYIKKVWGRKFTQLEADKTLVTIEKVYGVKLENEFRDEETQEC